VYLLGQACEIEHGLMCEYLYAQFSLKRGLDEGLSPAQLARHAQPLTAGDARLVAVAQEWRTVGHLYRGIEAGLADLCARYGEDAVFIGPARAQAVTEIFEWPELIAVTDLVSAGRAIETIVEQGEGARGDWIRAHFGTFVGILEDLLAMQAADPAFNPALGRQDGLGALAPLASKLHAMSQDIGTRPQDERPTAAPWQTSRTR
jgi:ferritin-like protein